MLASSYPLAYLVWGPKAVGSYSGGEDCGPGRQCQNGVSTECRFCSPTGSVLPVSHTRAFRPEASCQPSNQKRKSVIAWLRPDLILLLQSYMVGLWTRNIIINTCNKILNLICGSFLFLCCFTDNERVSIQSFLTVNAGNSIGATGPQIIFVKTAPSGWVFKNLR